MSMTLRAPHSIAVISRSQAKNANATRYFTGNPCKHGHVAERNTGSGSCCECSRISAVAKYREDPVTARARAAEIRASNPDASRSAGRKSYVANAEKRRQRARNDYYANHERAKERARAWKASNKERALSGTKGWRIRNSKHVSEFGRKYRAENAEAIAQSAKAHRANNMERHALYERRRRARKADAYGSHTIEDVETIKKAQKNRCAYCQISLGKKFHVDHIMPLALGGSDDRANIQLACARCNTSKNARHPIAFAQSIGLLI